MRKNALRGAALLGVFLAALTLTLFAQTASQGGAFLPTQNYVVTGTWKFSGQITNTSATPPLCSSNCGTSVPAIVGSDSGGIVTMGSGGAPASGWVVTFNQPWPAAPGCDVMATKTGMAAGKQAIVVATTTTTMTVTTNGTAPSTGDTYTFSCFGVQ